MVYSQNNGQFYFNHKIYESVEVVINDKDLGKLVFHILKYGSKSKVIFEEFNSAPVDGTVRLFLDDNSIIKMIDRNIQDEVNNKTYTLYSLNETEVKKLSKVNIKAIRFGNYENEQKDIFSISFNRTAILISNIDHYYFDPYSYKTVLRKRAEVSALFNKIFN